MGGPPARFEELHRGQRAVAYPADCLWDCPIAGLCPRQEFLRAPSVARVSCPTSKRIASCAGIRPPALSTNSAYHTSVAAPDESTSNRRRQAPASRASRFTGAVSVCIAPTAWKSCLDGGSMPAVLATNVPVATPGSIFLASMPSLCCIEPTRLLQFRQICSDLQSSPRPPLYRRAVFAAAVSSQSDAFSG